jgi:hypothetical protein
MWEVKVSRFPFMGWRLFTLQPLKAGEQVLPFVGESYSKSDFRALWRSDTRFRQYVLRADDNIYIDGDVCDGNMAGFINSSRGRSFIANVLWEYCPLPAPWNSRDWDYTMMIAARDIA